MFCSKSCLDEFYETFKGFKKLETPQKNLHSLLKAVKISDNCEDLERMYTDGVSTTVFDYDWRLLKSSKIELNLLKCAASLKKQETSNSPASKQTREYIKILCDRIKKTNQLKESAETLCRVITSQFKITVCNSICLNLISGEQHGTGVFPFVSLINHSCDQNVHIVSVDNCASVVVTQPIKDGEQLFYGYQ